ncbi:MAG: thiamine phosphate synthase, partial [Chloroflexota bacterium]
RAQEALRVLEEVAKAQDCPLRLSSDKFMRARFSLYTIERELVARLLRQDKLHLINGLYAVIDTQSLRGRSHYEVAEAVIRGGARVIQLRDKLSSKKELFPIAVGLKKLCAGHGVLFIMNDYLDLALATGADGLHVGQNDMPVKEARRLLPMDKILGCSVRTVAEATQAEADGADYLGCGAIYATLSKGDAVVVGLERVSEVRKVTTLPVVAIGGITIENAADVIAVGANAVAVISAILGAASVEEATRQVIANIRQDGARDNG